MSEILVLMMHTLELFTMLVTDGKEHKRKVCVPVPFTVNLKTFFSKRLRSLIHANNLTVGEFTLAFFPMFRTSIQLSNNGSYI